MKVLLLYPEFPDTFWSFRHALPFLGKRSAYPPLGLLTVSALLPPHWERKLVDLNIEKLCDKDLAWADVAFLSAMLVQAPSLSDLITRCRSVGLRTVVGGPITSGEHPDYRDVLLGSVLGHRDLVAAFAVHLNRQHDGLLHERGGIGFGPGLVRE